MIEEQIKLHCVEGVGMIIKIQTVETYAEQITSFLQVWYREWGGQREELQIERLKIYQLATTCRLYLDLDSNIKANKQAFETVKI